MDSRTSRPKIGSEKMLSLPKILLHDYLERSVRPETLLELLPEAKLPSSMAEVMKAGDLQKGASMLQEHLTSSARSSSSAYLQAVRDHVVPVLQDRSNLMRITAERLDDAAKDGIIGMHLRISPQLYAGKHMKLSQVMDALIEGLAKATIPVRLVLSALRQENHAVARELADLAIHYKDHVGGFDLSGDEAACPGVPEWWGEEAQRVREHDIALTINLWETNEPTEEDVERLGRFHIFALGHGIRGNQQYNRLLEVCPSANVLTGQIDSVEKHPLDRLYRQGRRVTVNTDGTLFAQTTLSREYELLENNFGWDLPDFYKVNLTALQASSFADEDKKALKERLDNGYLQISTQVI